MWVFVAILVGGIVDWPMFQHNPLHSAYQEGIGKLCRAEDVQIAWNIYIPGWQIEGAPVTGDINGDGKTEILFCYDHNLMAVSGTDGTTLWEFNADLRATTPLIVYIDGKPNVFVATNDGEAYMLNGADGSIVWSTTLSPGASDNMGFNSPVAKDVDDDSMIEIFFGTVGGVIYALKGDGVYLWGYPLPNGDYTTSAPAIGDIDGDSKDEVVIHTLHGRVIALDATTGSKEWEFYRPENWGRSSPSLGDIDGDGDLEIAVATDIHSPSDALYMLDGNGTVLWQFPTGVYSDMTPIIIDVDYDGQKEVLFGTSWGDEAFYCLNALDGSVEWRIEYPGYNPGFASPSVADIDNDGYLEAIIAAQVSGWQGGMIAAINHDGTRLWEFEHPPELAVNWSLKGPTIADVNNDGYLDIVWTSCLYPGWSHAGYLIVIPSPAPPNVIRVTDTYGMPGWEVAVPIEMMNSEEVAGIQFVMVFDKNYVTPVGVELGAHASNMDDPMYNIWDDSIKVCIFSTSGNTIPAGEGVIVKLVFYIDSTVTVGDSTLLQLIDVRVADTDAHPIQFDIQDGWLHFTELLKGDINCDGQIDIYDVVRCINIILGIGVPPSDYELWAADVVPPPDGDGEVNILDVIGIVKLILHQEIGVGGPPVVASVEVGTPIFNSGSSATIAVKLSTNGDIGGMQLMFNYDPAVVDITRVRLNPVYDGFNVAYNAKDGELKVLLYSETGDHLPAGEHELLEISVSTSSDLCDPPLILKHAVVGTKDARLVATTIMQHSLILVVTPNPIIYRATIECYTGDGLPELTIYDMMGRVVATLNPIEKEANHYVAVWDIDGNVRSGHYFLRVSTQREQLIKKLTVIH